MDVHSVTRRLEAERWHYFTFGMAEVMPRDVFSISYDFYPHNKPYLSATLGAA